MILHWSYLLLNNLQFWLPKFPAFAEAMRIKLATLPNEDNRQYFPSAYDQACGFCAMGAIDNTMNATCRPGGPRTGGEQAPRWDIDLFSKHDGRDGRSCMESSGKL